MEKFLNKKYQIDQVDDSYDAYLVEIGVSAENRKLAKESKATIQLVKLSANEYSLNTIVGSKIFEVKFAMNQETERTTLDGRKVKSSFAFDGNKLTERQIEASREVTTSRIFSDSNLIIESVVGNIKTVTKCVLVE